MGYNEATARRARAALAHRPGLTERKMFGGICFLLEGNMCCGVLNDELIVRVRPEDYEAALRRPHTRALDLTGRPMKGFVVVLPEGMRGDKNFKNWITTGVRCARSRPPKLAPGRRR